MTRTEFIFGVLLVIGSFISWGFMLIQIAVRFQAVL